MAKQAFTIGIADVKNLVPADYVGNKLHSLYKELHDIGRCRW